MPKKPSSSIFGRVRGILGKGQLQRAIEEVQSALKKDPTDMRLLHKLGDLYAKSDQLPQAVEAYVKVAETYFERSFFQKSLAVYKKVSKLVPERLDLQHRLAEVYGALDRRSDALNQYQELAQAYESRQLTSKCIAVFREMVQLEPTNIPIRVKLAELYLSTSSQEEAIDEFLDALSQLKGEQRWSDYIKVAERLLFVDPENLDILKNLAELYLHEDDTMKAVAKLQQAFKIDRQDPDTLELLAEAFIKLGQHKKILSVLHELAKVYTSNNATDKAREVYQQILEYDPNDAVAHQGLQTLPPESVEEMAAVAVEEVSDFEVEEVDDFEVEEVSDFEDSTTEAPLSAPQSTSEIDELVAEAEVYLKYGLLHKVQETLDNVLPQMPNHYRARKLQIDLLRQQDEHEQAASQLLQLARELGKTPEGLECVEAILEFEELSAELQEEAYQLHVSLQNIATPAPASEVQEIEYHDFDDDDTTYQPSSQMEMMGATEVVEEVEEIEDIDMFSHESLEAIPAAPPAQVYNDASETTDIREAFVPPVSDPTPAESFPVPEPPATPAPYNPPSFAPPQEEKGDDPFAQFLSSRDKQEIEDEDIHQATGNFESFLSEPIEVEQPETPGGSGAGWGDESVSDMEAAAARLEALIRAKEGDEEESGAASAAPPTPPPPAPFSIPAPPTLATSQEEVQEEAPPPLSFTPPPPSQPIEEPMLDEEPTLDGDATPAEGVPSFSEEIPQDTTTSSMEAIDSIEEPLTTDPTPAEGVPSFSDQATQESFELDDVDGLLDGFDDEEEIVEDAGDLIIEEFDEFSQYAEELEEAILYMEQEEYEYALELYQQVLEQDPENREAREGHDKALIGIERQNKAREQQRAEAIEFDLDSALGTTTPGSSRSRARAVEAINEFTKAVQEQVGEEEGETHFELGIAYREMGLFSQAVEAFELCRRGRYREIDSLKMIGHCQIAQGRIDEAIQSYQLALEHPSLRPAERVDLLFESGSAYELGNMTEQALQCFEEVSQIDADYRGVQEKIQNLRAL